MLCCSTFRFEQASENSTAQHYSNEFNVIIHAFHAPEEINEQNHAAVTCTEALQARTREQKSMSQL